MAHIRILAVYNSRWDRGLSQYIPTDTGSCAMDGDRIDSTARADSTSALFPIPSSMTAPAPQENDPSVYKLYKWRFVGLFGMVRHSVKYRPMTWRIDCGLIFG